MNKLAQLKNQETVHGAEAFGRKGPQFLTMTRADFAAYEYLCRQAEAKEWIENVIGETLPDEDLWKSLGNGIVLCKLINCMWPGEIPRYHPADSFSFKLLENIELFLAACERHGFPREDLFTPSDLFEKKNMPLVLTTLYKFAESAVKQGFQVKWKKRANLDFTPKQIQEAKKLEGVNLWEKPKGKNLSEVRKKLPEILLTATRKKRGNDKRLKKKRRNQNA